MGYVYNGALEGNKEMTKDDLSAGLVALAVAVLWAIVLMALVK